MTGYELLGEKTAQVYYQRAVLGNDWQPLMPIKVTRTSSTVVTVQFHVPVPPLVWDTVVRRPAHHRVEERQGVRALHLERQRHHQLGRHLRRLRPITASAALPTSGLTVAYALTNQGKQSTNHSKAVRWGQLLRFDPFMGGTTNMPNPNYAVSFSQPVP